MGLSFILYVLVPKHYAKCFSPCKQSHLAICLNLRRLTGPDGVRPLLLADLLPFCLPCLYVFNCSKLLTAYAITNLSESWGRLFLISSSRDSVMSDLYLDGQQRAVINMLKCHHQASAWWKVSYKTHTLRLMARPYQKSGPLWSRNKTDSNCSARLFSRWVSLTRTEASQDLRVWPAHKTQGDHLGH